MAKVKIRPVVKGGHRLGWEKYGFNRAPGTGYFIEALPDYYTKIRATGLTKQEAEELGKEINEDLSPHSKFWDGFAVKLEDEDQVFDTNIPMDRIKIAVLKASKLVANSETERMEGKYPEAKYVIYDSADETEIKSSRIANKLEATGYIASTTPTKRKWVATILFNEEFETQTDKFAKVQLMEFVEANSKNIDTFNNLIRKSDDRIESEYLVHLGVIRNVLKYRGGRYLRGDEEIGYDYERAVDWMTSPKNQDKRFQITAQLESLNPQKVTKEEKRAEYVNSSVNTETVEYASDEASEEVKKEPAKRGPKPKSE